MSLNNILTISQRNSHTRLARVPLICNPTYSADSRISSTPLRHADVSPVCLIPEMVQFSSNLRWFRSLLILPTNLDVLSLRKFHIMVRIKAHYLYALKLGLISFIQTSVVKTPTSPEAESSLFLRILSLCSRISCWCSRDPNTYTYWASTTLAQLYRLLRFLRREGLLLPSDTSTEGF